MEDAAPAVIASKLRLNAAPSVWQRIAALRITSEADLAPTFRAAIDATLAECQYTTVAVSGVNGRRTLIRLDATINETLRTDALQRIYYAQGTSNAQTAEHSWHYYGLAVDVISAKYEWFDGPAARMEWPGDVMRAAVGAAWFRAVAEIAIRHGCEWGGHWHVPDLPHLQWNRCPPSPHEAPALYTAAGGGAAGRAAVWAAVKAA